jgi:hypothetical protein
MHFDIICPSFFNHLHLSTSFVWLSSSFYICRHHLSEFLREFTSVDVICPSFFKHLHLSTSFVWVYSSFYICRHRLSAHLLAFTLVSELLLARSYCHSVLAFNSKGNWFLQLLNAYIIRQIWVIFFPYLMRFRTQNTPVGICGISVGNPRNLLISETPILIICLLRLYV